jgi:hypothetical protein
LHLHCTYAVVGFCSGLLFLWTSLCRAVISRARKSRRRSSFVQPPAFYRIFVSSQCIHVDCVFISDWTHTTILATYVASVERLLSQSSSRGILEYSLRLAIACRLVGRLYGLPSETPGSSSNEHLFLRHSFTRIALCVPQRLIHRSQVPVRATVAYQLFASTGTCMCRSGLSAMVSSQASS